jgi:hypothetical protein
MARHTIPAQPVQPRTHAVDVILPDPQEARFVVTAADIPSGLPTTFNDRTISWFSNFRVDKKPRQQNTGATVQYTIEFDAVPGAVQYVYYDDDAGQVKELTTSPANNRLQAKLSVADPPIGKV